MKRTLALASLLYGLAAMNLGAAPSATSILTNNYVEFNGVAVRTNLPAQSGVVELYYLSITDIYYGNGDIMEYNPDDGKERLLASGLNDPQGLVVARNQLILSESGKHRIVGVNFNTGEITVLAGGIQGSQDGPGASAGFNAPTGLAADAQGNIYVADLANGAVRRINTSNQVSTLATGLYRPSAVAVAEDGRVFVAETGNHAILLIGTNGTVTRIAGSGVPYLNGYRGGPNPILGVNALLSAPRGLIWAGGKTGLLISDTGNGLVRQLTFNTSSQWVISDFVGGLKEPVAMARDSLGNFPLTDPGDKAVKLLTLTAPMPPVAPPIIGQAILTTNFFGDLTTALIPITNATFNNDIIVAVKREANTRVDLWIAKSRDGDYTQATAPHYADGSPVLPENAISIPMDGPDVYLKAIGSAQARRPSPEVSASLHFEVADPVVRGSDPGNIQMDVATAGARVWFTVDGSVPVDGQTESSRQYDTSGQLPINIYQYVATTNDVRLRVRAFKNGYAPSRVVERTYRFADLQVSSIGIPKDYHTGPGATVIVPINVKIQTDLELRSLQYRVEVEPLEVNGTRLGPDLMHNLRAYSANPTNDFIALKAPNAQPGPAYFIDTPYTENHSRGMIITFLGTNANIKIEDYGAVGIIGVPIPPNAPNGSQYRVRLLYPSATADGYQFPLSLTPLPDRIIYVTNNIGYVVGDTALASWYNVGDFGNGNLNNNDVNNAYYASLGIRTPYQDSDVFDAMDSFPLDSTFATGGDGQIRYLDWQTTLLRALRRDTNVWRRTYAEGGRRTIATTNLNNLPNRPAEPLSSSGPAPAWSRQAVLGALPVENAQPGQTVRVPIYLKSLTGRKVLGLQFRAMVLPEDGAPPIQSYVQFHHDDSVTPAMSLTGGQEGMPNNHTVGAWSLAQSPLPASLQLSNRIGYITFTLPADAVAGQRYTVRFAFADGAPDLNTQYDFETFPGTVWVGGPAAREPEKISDEWKIRFFGGYANRWAADEADPDGDGVSNLEAYRAGQNPVRLRLQALAESAQDGQPRKGFRMRWFAEKGRTYIVESTDNPVNGVWTPVTTEVGAGDLQEALDSVTDAATRFYRVRALQP